MDLLVKLTFGKSAVIDNSFFLVDHFCFLELLDFDGNRRTVHRKPEVSQDFVLGKHSFDQSFVPLDPLLGVLNLVLSDLSHLEWVLSDGGGERPSVAEESWEVESLIPEVDEQAWLACLLSSEPNVVDDLKVLSNRSPHLFHFEDLLRVSRVPNGLLPLEDCGLWSRLEGDAIDLVGTRKVARDDHDSFFSFYWGVVVLDLFVRVAFIYVLLDFVHHRLSLDKLGAAVENHEDSVVALLGCEVVASPSPEAEVFDKSFVLGIIELFSHADLAVVLFAQSFLYHLLEVGEEAAHHLLVLGALVAQVEAFSQFDGQLVDSASEGSFDVLQGDLLGAEDVGVGEEVDSERGN